MERRAQIAEINQKMAELSVRISQLDKKIVALPPSTRGTPTIEHRLREKMRPLVTEYRELKQARDELLQNRRRSSSLKLFTTQSI